MIVPILGCDNSHAALEFYVEALGFELLARFQLSNNASDPAYVTLGLNGHHLHLSSFPNAQASGKMAYVYLASPADVDRLYERIKNDERLEMNIPLVDQTWGMREFGFVDAYGNKLTFGSALSHN